jgi:hypothetical protein
MKTIHMAKLAAGALMTLLLAAGTAHASGLTPPPIVPEIDGATMASGLGVLTGGVLILRAYWRSR